MAAITQTILELFSALLFGTSIILPSVLGIYTNISTSDFLYISIGQLCTLCVSIAIKVYLIFFKQRRITFKEFILSSQLKFILTYIFMAAQLAFFIESMFFQNAFFQWQNQSDNIYPNQVSTILQSISSILMAFACSLIGSYKTTTYKEYWIYFITIVGETVLMAIVTVQSIQLSNQNYDHLNYQITNYILNGGSGIQNYVPFMSFNLIYKDFILAKLGIVVAINFILMDLISRPFQDREDEEQFNLKYHIKNKDQDQQHNNSENQSNRKTQIKNNLLLTNNFLHNRKQTERKQKQKLKQIELEQK